MIGFRPLTSDDFPMLLEWLQRPHVRQWWDDGDDTLAKVAAHYSRDAKNTKRFIAEVRGQPTGYFQYHCFSGEHVGIDQFLADGDALSKGLGTQCLLAFVKVIDENESGKTISVDPHPQNKRGIRCYEKCGFIYDPAHSSSTIYFMARKR